MPPPLPSAGQRGGGPRYDDEYAYNPPSNPPPSYTKTSHRHKEDQYEMVERKNVVASASPDLVSIEAFFAEVNSL